MTVVVRNAVALVRVVDDEAEGPVLARVRVALLEDDVATIAGKTCRMGQVASVKLLLKS